MPVGATLASAAATVGSGVLQSNAAGNASKAAQDASAANLNFIKGVYSDAQGNLKPTIQQGLGAGSTLAGLLGIGGDPQASQRAFDTFRNSTNYNFLLDQGTQAVKTANAPSFNSGATAKALLNYGQGMAGNALAGYEGLLSGQQQLGTQAALGLGSIGVGQSGQFASANNNAAGAAGSAGIYGANAQGSALQGLGSLFANRQTASSFAPQDTFAAQTSGSGINIGAGSAVDGLF
jgi:hypothetical protein